MHSLFLLLQLLLLLLSGGVPANTAPDVFALPPPPAGTPNATLEYFDPTLPPILPTQNPRCSVVVLQYDFADTVDAPPASANYTPPTDCPAPWSRVVLELSASASDMQKDRIAAIWLNGAELLRTSTPFAMSPGVHWRVLKDITRYTSLLRGGGSVDSDQDGGSMIYMMLENSLETFSGVYSVNVTLNFYRGALREDRDEQIGSILSTELGAHPTIKGLYPEPADMIIPISNPAGDSGSGFWFQLTNETDVQVSSVVVPNNTYRAVLEVYLSHHQDDEYWYANPLRATGPQLGGVLSDAKANGGFRQMVATIDGRYVGSAIPFPVIHPGSVNPYFWAPVAAIGAYDHPSYDVDITPFVGQLIDGQPHEFGITVKDSQPYWLVSANLHLWLDAWSDDVEGGLVRYKVPPLRLSRQADWRESDGKSEVEGQVIVRLSGWVSSSKGNITTNVRHKIKFKSHVEVEGHGAIKQVEMESKSRINIRVEREHAVIGRVLVDMEAPLQMETVSSNGGGGSRFHKMKLFHELAEMRSMEEAGRERFSTMTDRQESEGSVLEQEAGAAMWGSGDTKSTYKFRDNKACYLRTVMVVGGRVKQDEATASCAAAADD